MLDGVVMKVGCPPRLSLSTRTVTNPPNIGALGYDDRTMNHRDQSATDTGKNTLLELALTRALEAHWGQVDKAGQPYILHPLWVMAQVSSLEEKLVAILHDAMEDSALTAEQLREDGFPSPVIDALCLLTKPREEDYLQYVQRIRTSSLARNVKIADLRHNIDVTRLGRLDEADLQRVSKYHRALHMLTNDDASTEEMSAV